MKALESLTHYNRRTRFSAALALLVSSGFVFAQTLQGTLVGTAQLHGKTQLNSQRYIQIMALDPPAINAGTNSEYATFRTYVMTQNSVDGVTVEIQWANVETKDPSLTSCGPPSKTCQLDAVGMYHTYDWSAYESSSAPPGFYPWFDEFPTGSGKRKKVNLILSGINGATGINNATPWYVTSSGYVSLFTPNTNRQDVLNLAKDCSGIPWKGTPVNTPDVTFSRTATRINVHSNSCCDMTLNPLTAIRDGDQLWVYGGDSHYTTPISGTPLIRDGNSDFHYFISTDPPTSDSCTTGCTYITAAQSSPVPYEEPYVIAWEAFMAAANLNFNPNYTVGITVVGSNGTNQLGYIRSGTWTGGESYAPCVTGGLSGGLSNLGPPYKYTFTSGANNTWLSDYTRKVDYIQTLSPTLARFWSIDELNNDVTYAQAMAPVAVSVTDSRGYVNGFGSQGLSLLDALPPGCSGAIADWCNLFAAQAAHGSPLELQQISISDPTNTTCPGSTCGLPPNGVAGDLRLWLPFAAAHNANVFELYSGDLGLAYDPKYCTSQSPPGDCAAGYFPQFITKTQQWTFFSGATGFTGVGQGMSCTPFGSGSTIGSGDCSYAATIDSVHSLH